MTEPVASDEVPVRCPRCGRAGYVRLLECRQKQRLLVHHPDRVCDLGELTPDNLRWLLDQIARLHEEVLKRVRRAQ